MIYTPRPYQQIIRSFALNHERCNIFASPGMGKTGATYDIIDSLRLMGEVKRTLVLAPVRVAQSSWPDEQTKWRESFGHLKVAAAIGNPSQRLAALRSNPDILAINYENIPWLIEQYGDQWPFDTVVADESGRLRGMRVSMQHGHKKDGSLGKEHIRGQGSTRAKALAGVAHKHVRRWINLTGSPAPNGIKDVWAQQWFVDGGYRLGNSFTAFAQRWFRAVPGSDGYSSIEPMPFAQEQIQKLLAQTSITVDAKDWFDIDEPIERHIMIDLPPKARQQYREMQKELFTWVEEHPLEAFNAGAKSQKCLQIASGSVWVDREEKMWAEVHNEKLDALKSIVTETAGEPLLIAYQFRPDVERILKAFPQFKLLDNKKQTITDFQQGKIPGLLVHGASAGHGLDLQHNCRTLVDYSSGFDLDHDEQLLARVGPVRQMQIKSGKAVFRYRIVARGTIEETAVLPRLKSKAEVQDALKAAMKISQ